MEGALRENDYAGEVSFSEKNFEIASNSSKKVWIYLTAKKSKGEHTLNLIAHSTLNGTSATQLKVTLLNKDCPNNPSINVGNDGSGEWSYGGEFIGSETADLLNGLNKAIASCKGFGLCSGQSYLAKVPPLLGGYYPCIDDDGKCLIPVIFSVTDSGVFQISKINITYTE